MSKEQRITGNITAPNKDLEILKKHFSQCFDKNGNLDFEKLKKQLTKNEINFSKESYGMDWLGKSYARLLATDETTTLLKEDETFNQKNKNKNSENLLIKGDNLEVLKHLSNAYYEKIKMIYIDPPYNTGNDGFVYADDRKFTTQELQELAGISEERAKRILDFTQSNSNSHSAWLTFMYPRLYIAKQLLKEDGVIFISIDDNEVAQLRLLMDDIFGEENFIEQIIWRKKSGGGQQDDFFVTEHDYIICYSKNSTVFKLNEKSIEKTRNGYNKLDRETGKKYKQIKLAKWGSAAHKEDRLTMSFSLIDPDGNENKPIAPDGRDGRWRYGRQSINQMIEEDRIEFVKKNGEWIAYEKEFEPTDGETKIIKERSIIYDLVENTSGSKELTELFGSKDIFDNPKPTDLLQHLIILATIPLAEDIILDFFAGSGTTGDAIMQLNAEDDGNRKFILAQLPELIDQKNNKTAYDFVKNELKVEKPTIFEITKERLIRASKKIQEETIKTKITEKQKEIKDLESQLDIDDKAENIKQLKSEIKALKNQDLGFKIFETMPIWEDYNIEADELDTQQTLLFDESKLTKEDIKALLVTWKTYDGVSLTQTLQNIDLVGYTGHYSNGKLYLMDKGFKTKNLKTLLEKIDSDPNFNPTTIIAFGYHFESKNLREISENIKSYANKKNIDVDFITRY